MRVRLGAMLGTLVVSSPVAADELVEARRLEAMLEYERALVVVERALAAGGAEPARLVELHLLAGKLAAGLDRVVVAEDHFARALAVRPAAMLPDGTSPKLTTPFDAARRRTTALVVTSRVVRGLASVTADPDPLGIVVGIAARVVDAGGRHDEIVARTATRVTVPAGVTVLELAALDASGNRVWLGAGTAAPIVFEPTSRPPSPSLVVRWPTWALVTGAFAGLGGILAWQHAGLQNDWNRLRAEPGQHDYSELVAVQTRGERYALAANISFGLATAALVTTAVLFARGTPASPASPPSLAITAGAGTFGIAGRF